MVDENIESPDHAINVVRRMLHVWEWFWIIPRPRFSDTFQKNIRIAVLKTPLVDEDVGVAASIRIVNAQKLQKEDFLKSGTATDDMMELLSRLSVTAFLRAVRAQHQAERQRLRLAADHHSAR